MRVEAVEPEVVEPEVVEVVVVVDWGESGCGHRMGGLGNGEYGSRFRNVSVGVGVEGVRGVVPTAPARCTFPLGSREKQFGVAAVFANTLPTTRCGLPITIASSPVQFHFRHKTDAATPRNYRKLISLSLT